MAFSRSATTAASSLFLLGPILLLVLITSPLAYAFDVDQCTVSLAGLLGDAGLNQCLPFQSLSRLLTEDITPALVNSTTTDFCVYPDCGQQTIALVQNTIVQNCLDGVNAPNDTTTAQIVYGVASLYPPLKQGLCTRIPDSGTFCLTNFAQSMGDYVKANPSPLGIRIFLNETVLKDYVAKVPKEILCTDCNKAIVTPLSSFVDRNMLSLRPEIVAWAKAAEKATIDKCGASFLDGQIPNLNSNGGNNNNGGSNKPQGAGHSLTKGQANLWNIMSALLLVAFAMLPL